MSSKKELSAKQEKEFCERMGVSKVIGSGATPFLKGDGLYENILFEMKTKVKECKSMSIKKEWFEKGLEQAHSMNKSECALVFSFGERDSITDEFINYVAVTDDLFEELFKSYKIVQDMLNEIGDLKPKVTDNDRDRLLKGFIKKHLQEADF